MSFKFEVGQEVVRVDSTTGVSWGAPVVIAYRNVQCLAAHGICENRYMFKEDGYAHDYHTAGSVLVVEKRTLFSL